MTQFIIEKNEHTLFEKTSYRDAKKVTQYFIQKKNWFGQYKYLTKLTPDWFYYRLYFPSLLDAIHYIYKEYNTLNINLIENKNREEKKL